MKGFTAYAAKALVAGLIAFVGALATAAMTGKISVAEVLTAVGAGLSGGYATYWTPNKPEQ